jgi:hypothetical protein
MPLTVPPRATTTGDASARRVWRTSAHLSRPAGVGRPGPGDDRDRTFGFRMFFSRATSTGKKFRMTSKAAFSPEEWTVVLEGPPSAGMIVVSAARGGLLRESIAMSKAYVEARAQHGESELLDEIVAAKPEIDHTRYHSPAELRENGLKHLRDATALLEGKATADELGEYRRFVLALAGKVAAAHKEEGQAESPAEAEAIEEITAALGTTSS